GGGGMGSVYKSVSTKFPGRRLAVKVLARKELSNPGNIRALLNEAEVSEQFKGFRFVAGCWDHGYADGEFFTVMPYVTGERLDVRIERLGKIPPEDVLKLTLHILAGEQHIFNAGFLFRDMKPENVIIDQKGYAIMIDFGLCIPLEAARNPNSEFISGSPYYMPPERLLGEPEDAFSEIYSIGMVMYHALTGHTLYDAEGLNELAQRHVSNIRVSHASKMDGIPQPIADLLVRMIAQSPAERPQSFVDVFEEIKAILAKGW
ncbi:MAG: serine/threonine protein kinase, partial [Victivallales bacterium]|nr:serine/threonine protein kinase [Victivallales bacterium]